MINQARKVFVLNALKAAGANVLVDTGLANSPAPFGLISIVDATSNNLVSFPKKDFQAIKIAKSDEVRQVSTITLPTLVAGVKYSLTRQPNLSYMAGRDANYFTNLKTYTYVAGTDTAANEKAKQIASITAKVNADTTNLATASSTTGVLIITESAGYGLLPTYPGPAFWMLTNVGATAHALTPGVVANGRGDIMLAQQAVWTPDKKWLRSGDLKYNFDKVLPLANLTYDTIVITVKSQSQDHTASDPNLTSEIILYVNDADAALQAFEYALSVKGVVAPTP